METAVSAPPSAGIQAYLLADVLATTGAHEVLPGLPRA